jgi:hypothetical protein
MFTSNMRYLIAFSAVLIGSATMAEETSPKITYDEHIRPIFREHCLTCHNSNQKKGDLALDNYAAAMDGGGSGEVVLAGDVESSRLYALVSHAEEPNMPPKADRLADAKLELIKKWIELGALENSGSVAKVNKQPTMDLSASTGAAKPDGPAAMPEGLFRQPVVHTERIGAITALATSPWAPLAAVAGQKQILLYNTDDGRLLGVLPFPEGVPYILKFSRSGSLLLAGGGHAAALGKVVVFDVKTGKRAFEVGDELDVVLAADINQAHTQIALGGPGRLVRIYSAADGTLLRELKKHTDWVYAIEFSPDGVLLATADRGNGLVVWEAETGREYQNLTGHQGAVTDVSWRADSNVLASASLDGSIRLWEMENGKQIKSWNAHAGGVEAIEFTHDGRLLSTGRDKLAKAWDANGSALKSFGGLNDFGLEAAFTHDGARALAGSLTGQLLVWNAGDARQVFTLSPNPPTLEILVAAETARAAAAEAALGQAQAELLAAQNALAGISRGELDKSTAVKADQEQQIAAKIAAMKPIDEQIAALTAGLATAPDDAAKQAANEKLVPLNQSKSTLAGELAILHAAIADTYRALKTAGDAYNAARAAAQKSVDEKQSAVQAATSAVHAATAARDAAIAEKTRFDQAQASAVR